MDIQSYVAISAFAGAGLSIGLGAIGSAIGEGCVASRANEAMARNKDLAGEIAKTMLLGQAVAESSAIFALLVSLILLFTEFDTSSFISAIVPISAGLCMGFGAIGSGIGSGFPAAATCIGISRQPLVRDRLTRTMLIGSAIAQTPSIFALVTALILIFSDFSLKPFSPTWAALLGAAFSSGLGTIGSGIGEGLVAEAGCEGIARQPLAAARVTNSMLLGMAVSETTAVYGLLISMILIFKTFIPTTALAPCIALLGAGICMGIGAIGPGIGEGFTGKNAVQWVARNESATGVLTRSMLVGQAVAESTGIYALVVALVMIFVI